MERKQIRKVEKVSRPQYHLDEDDMPTKIVEYDSKNRCLKIDFVNNFYRVTYRDGRIRDIRTLEIRQKTISRISFTVQMGLEVTGQNGQDDYKYVVGETLWYSENRMKKLLGSLEGVVSVELL